MIACKRAAAWANLSKAAERDGGVEVEIGAELEEIEWGLNIGICGFYCRRIREGYCGFYSSFEGVNEVWN